MQGIFGESVETPSVHLSVIKKNKKYSRRVHNTQELMDSFKQAFGT